MFYKKLSVQVLLYEILDFIPVVIIILSCFMLVSKIH